MSWHSKAMASYDHGWSDYVKGLKQALIDLEQDITEAEKMSDTCTLEWCEAIEHVVDELSNAIYSIHEPVFSTDEQSQSIKDMRKRIHEIYHRYKMVKI
jgi:hypothetical protein